jgi:signal transduction histidine kinase
MSTPLLRLGGFAVARVPVRLGEKLVAHSARRAVLMGKVYAADLLFRAPAGKHRGGRGGNQQTGSETCLDGHGTTVNAGLRGPSTAHRHLLVRFATDCRQGAHAASGYERVGIVSSSSLQTLLDEQSALRRVATVVAGETEQQRIFHVVTEEAGRLLEAQTCNLIRFEGNDLLYVLGGWSEPGVANIEPLQTLPLDGPTSTFLVHQTGRPARVDSLEDIPGDLARTLRESGLTSTVAAPIFVEGELWGAVAASSVNADPLPADAEQRLGGFAELVGQAIANAEAREALAASRARVVAAGDAARRRIERDLHDGAQQRLVALGMSLRVALATVGRDPEETRALLGRAIEELTAATSELRELARGIHPAVLTDHGLATAIAGLAKRSPLAVRTVRLPERRFESAVEAAAYFVVAEALTNSAHHGGDCSAVVELAVDDGHLTVDVTDDGPGGASLEAGSGLRGLADRVGAVGGHLTLLSYPGRGTTVKARLPC